MVEAVVRGMTAAQILPGLIIGVVVAVASAFVSHLLIRNRERERWKREDAHKDYTELREACVHLLAASDHIWNGARDAEAFGNLRLRWMEVRLIAPKEVAWAATDLHTTVRKLTPDTEIFVPTSEYASKAESFLAAARSELGKPPAKMVRPELVEDSPPDEDG